MKNNENTNDSVQLPCKNQQSNEKPLKLVNYKIDKDYVSERIPMMSFEILISKKAKKNPLKKIVFCTYNIE